jgi:phosphohistidine phosphatase
MKNLLLVRHAEATPGSATTSDFDRSLSERGLRDAPAMAARLAAHGLRPDVILASPAMRALTTASLFADSFGLAREAMVLMEDLYACGAHRLLDLVSATHDHVGCLMLVAHNPAISDVAHRWSHDIRHMPPCGVAEIQFDLGAWRDVKRTEPVKVRLHEPRMD